MNYFDHPYCSNSTLNALGAELGILPTIEGDKENAYRLGSLFDAIVTEPAKLDLIQKTIIGTDYTFSDDEYKTVKKMKMMLEADPIYKIFMRRNPDFQKEVYYEDFQFTEFKLNMRGKLDYFIERPGMVGDLKSTAATSQKTFDNAIQQFGYDRQMWLYCNLTGVDRAMIFGVSKSAPHKVFISKISRGDSRWNAAEKKINELAFKYLMLK